MSTLKPIIEQHTEHVAWLNKLSFYKDDLRILQHRLEEIARKYTSHEIMPQVEQFQNQLKVQDEQIDILKHEIKAHEMEIEKSITDNPVASDHRKATDHSGHRDSMQRFEELFAQLRHNMLDFISKWM